MAKNWTQDDLAGESGFERSYVSGPEVGRRNPTYLKLVRLARSLDIPVPSEKSLLVDTVEVAVGRGSRS
jgi:transcriptional regulator with XRE-family HTH domain